MNFSEQNNQQIGELKADMTNVKEDMRELRSDMRQVRTILDETRGSWRMLVIISGASAAFGAFLSKIAGFLPFLHKQ